MHKDKQGKVFASLTEVKNKTGDIFALVDEFGEVLITSYNKTRYKISKVNITNLIDLDKPETQKSERSTTAPKVAKAVKQEIAEEPVAVVKEVAKTQEKKLIGNEIHVQAYERANKQEREFTKRALMPLVNN